MAANDVMDDNEEFPWLLREMEIAGSRLPFSPVLLFGTLLCIALVGFILFTDSGTYCWAEARHILLKESTEDAEKRLLQWKKEIGNDLPKFNAYIKEHCPDFKNGGKLGRFYKGDLDPSFDKVVFDANVPVKTVVGPVKTSFGWHLIYIEKRSF